MNYLPLSTPSLVTEKNYHLSNIKAIGTVQNYLITSIIGGDHLYPVFIATSIDSVSTSKNSLVVLKAIPTSDTRASFENECSVFRLKASHKNVIKCIEILNNVRLDFGEYKGKEYHIFVLPYYSNGDLLDFLENARLDERTARYYFEQILDAVEYMQSQGLAHRDLKPENFLINEDFDIVLTDFGHTVRHSDTFGPKLFNGRDAITTPELCPPEFYSGKGYKAIEMDIFALGKLLFSLATGFSPFSSANGKDSKFSMIANGNWAKYWSLTMGFLKQKRVKIEEFSPEFKDLVERLLHPNPKSRPSIEEIRESSWFANIKPRSRDEMQTMMIRSSYSFKNESREEKM